MPVFEPRASTHARRAQRSVLAVLALLAACTGSVTSPDTPGAAGGTNTSDGRGGPAAGAGGGGGPGIDGTEAPLNCAEAPLDPGPSPLRLLTREQYVNTLRDLFGELVSSVSALQNVTQASAFGLLQADISQVEVEDYEKAADQIGAGVAANKSALAALAPCTDSNKRNCARTFIERFGARAYRAPLSEASDLDRHLTLYDLGAKTSHEHGMELLIRGMLQSPRFLYRVELGSAEKVADNAVKLSSYELAARLSYVFWKSLPDDVLSKAASEGKLSSKEQLSAQLERMLIHPKGAHALREFLEAFMHLGQIDSLVKSSTLFPEWENAALRSSLKAQAHSFFDHVLDSEAGKLQALLGSQTVFYDKQLGSYYGVSGGDSMQSMLRDDDTASGLLTLPAFLAIQAKPDQTSPINRGKFVREALLCEQLPAPPADIPKPPEVMAGVSSRERLRQHEVDPSCNYCHKRLDPIGFGLEHFDAIGRYRSEEGGKPIDASGELIGTKDLDGKFEGAVQLGQRLAQSPQVQDCIARQWFRFALGRFEQPSDGCMVERLSGAFQDGEASLHTLPRAIIESDAFLYRRPIVQESP